MINIWPWMLHCLWWIMPIIKTKLRVSLRVSSQLRCILGSTDVPVPWKTKSMNSSYIQMRFVIMILLGQICIQMAAWWDISCTVCDLNQGSCSSCLYHSCFSSSDRLAQSHACMGNGWKWLNIHWHGSQDMAWFVTASGLQPCIKMTMFVWEGILIFLMKS